MVWRRGERGERGDPGHEGVGGYTGETGGVAPDDLDRLVVKVTGDALAESHVKATDKRLLIIFVMIVGGLGLVSFVNDRRDHERFQEFRSAVVQVCQKTNEDNTRVNAVLEQLAVNAETGVIEGYTPQQAEARAKHYRSLFLSITKCPPDR